MVSEWDSRDHTDTDMGIASHNPDNPQGVSDPDNKQGMVSGGDVNMQGKV